MTETPEQRADALAGLVARDVADDRRPDTTEREPYRPELGELRPAPTPANPAYPPVDMNPDRLAAAIPRRA